MARDEVPMVPMLPMLPMWISGPPTRTLGLEQTTLMRRKWRRPGVRTRRMGLSVRLENGRTPPGFCREEALATCPLWRVRGLEVP